MARIYKAGLDYFPWDVAFMQSRRMRRLIRKQGIVAVPAMVSLLSHTYGERGYYLVWNEDTCFDLSEEVDTDMDKMQSIIKDAILVGFFDEKQFLENEILTSIEIQEQYLTCTQKRKTVEMEEKYRLSSLKYTSSVPSAPQTTLWGAETPENVVVSQQRKEKERKAEESKEEGGKGDGKVLVNDRWIPEYCLDKRTHNYDGLLYRLSEIRVKDEKEIDAILKLSNYGRKGHPLWGIISHSNWPPGGKIKLPGRFILSQLRSG